MAVQSCCKIFSIIVSGVQSSEQTTSDWQSSEVYSPKLICWPLLLLQHHLIGKRFQKFCTWKVSLKLLSCDRLNIKHVCIKAPGSINECLSWLCQDIMAMKENATKSIIFCRNIKSCGLIYHYLLSENVFQNSYIGTCSSSNRLFSMYHYSTAPQTRKSLWTIL